MAYFSEDFLDQIRLASDLLSLISEDTSLKGQGDRFMGLCPFPEHNEKTPSFSVSQSRQIYHCFGCQNSGNIFTYLKKQRGMSFVESVEYLANKNGIALPKKQNYKPASSNQQFLQLNKKICFFYKQRLKESPSGHPVRKYLAQRGLTEELMDCFHLGYAPKGRALLDFLRDPKERKAGEALGLLNRSQEGELYDNFRHRLIFPIFSIQKQVLGFGARALDDSLPKYINSKESQIFHKGKVLYGLNESARYLRKESVILIVEGYTDFLSLWRAGFKNLGATLGTALTASHARLLKRYVDSVVLVFDGDEAGLKASERSLPLLLEMGLEVKFLSLPESQDPDDFIRSYGKKAFQSKLQGAEDFFFFLLQKKYQELKNLGKTKNYLIEEISPILSSVQNKAMRGIYKQRLLDLFGSDASLMEKILNERLKKKKASHSVGQNKRKTELGGQSLISREEAAVGQNKRKTELGGQSLISREEAALGQKSQKTKLEKAFSLKEALESERLLLVLCLESEELLNRFIEVKALSFVKTPEMKKIFEEMIESYRQEPASFDSLAHLIMNKFSDTNLIFKASYPIFNNADEREQKRIFLDCINFLKKKEQHSVASELMAKTKMGYDKEDMRYLEKVFQLTKQRLQQRNKPKS